MCVCVAFFAVPNHRPHPPYQPRRHDTQKDSSTLHGPLYATQRVLEAPRCPWLLGGNGVCATAGLLDCQFNLQAATTSCASSGPGPAVVTTTRTTAHSTRTSTTTASYSAAAGAATEQHFC